jgi:PAS domain-containing protein
LGASDPADVIGKSDFDFFAHDLAVASNDDEKRIMLTRQPMEGKVEEKLHLDGRKGWALVSKIPLWDGEGLLIGTCGISKDITPLKEAEQALEMANAKLASQKQELEQALASLHITHEKLKSAQEQLVNYENSQWIARLAYGVAHEIRNPLCVAEMGVTALIQNPNLAETEDGRELLKGMGDAFRRADVVITALMDGAKSSGLTVDSDDIAATVEKAVNIMKTATPSLSTNT